MSNNQSALQNLFDAIRRYQAAGHFDSDSRVAGGLKTSLRAFAALYHTEFPDDVKEIVKGHALMPVNITGACPVRTQTHYAGGSVHETGCLIIFRLEQALREISENTYGTTRSRLFVIEQAEKHLNICVTHKMVSTGEYKPAHNVIEDCFPPVGNMTLGDQKRFKDKLSAFLPIFIEEVKWQLPAFSCKCGRAHTHPETVFVTEEVAPVFEASKTVVAMTPVEVGKAMIAAIRNYDMHTSNIGNLIRKVYGPANWVSVSMESVIRETWTNLLLQGASREDAVTILGLTAKSYFDNEREFDQEINTDMTVAPRCDIG